MTLITKSKKIRRNSEQLKRKYKIHDDVKRKEIIEKNKQKIQSLNNRVKRYTTREKQFADNKMFYEKQDQFYNEL